MNMICISFLIISDLLILREEKWRDYTDPLDVDIKDDRI